MSSLQVLMAQSTNLPDLSSPFKPCEVPVAADIAVSMIHSYASSLLNSNLIEEGPFKDNYRARLQKLEKQESSSFSSRIGNVFSRMFNWISSSRISRTITNKWRKWTYKPSDAKPLISMLTVMQTANTVNILKQHPALKTKSDVITNLSDIVLGNETWGRLEGDEEDTVIGGSPSCFKQITDSNNYETVQGVAHRILTTLLGSEKTDLDNAEVDGLLLIVAQSDLAKKYAETASESGIESDDEKV